MLRYTPFLALAALLLVWACTPKKKPMTELPPEPLSNTEYDEYAARWAKVDSLRQERLPKSMLTEVNEIYALAQRAGNEPQLVKSLIYRAALEQQVQEIPTEAYFTKLRSAIAETERVGAKALLESILAEAYEQYARNNQWQIRDRTPLLSDRDGRSVDTWTLEDLEAESNALFLRSARYPETQRTAIADYAALLTTGENTEGLRPTLYDFLANRAIEHLLNTATQLTTPVYAYRLDDPRAFGPARAFADWELTTKDSTSAKYGAVRLLQEWLGFRLRQNEVDALLDADLKRLELVHQLYVGADKDALYADALERLQTEYSERDLAATAIFQRAQLLQNAGGSWQAIAGEVDDSLRLKTRRAVELCRTAVNNYPDSYGAQRCAQLIYNAAQPQLLLETEQVNLPDQALPVLVRYRNVPELHLRVIRMSDERMRVYETMQRSRKQDQTINFLRGLPAAQSHVYNLPDKADYREHRVEVKIDALPSGTYALLAGASAAFDADDANVGEGFFVVSNLGSWNRNLPDGEAEITVFDREAGDPLSDVAVDLFTYQYNSAARKQVRKLWRTLYTDQKGQVRVPRSEERRLQYVLRHQRDTLDTEQGIYTGYRSGQARTRQRTEFYLDRAIYRPGQTVYFKAIALEQDPAGRPRILPQRSMTVRLYDTNGQEVEKQQLTTNAYGSAQGSFTAPQGGLTGTMRISSDEGSKSFRVEEYKRPKFSVDFAPVAQSYRLGEEVTVTGSAEAYAGAPVDGATVRYRVTREVRYPYWWYRGPRPGDAAQQLAAGEATTDGTGTFTVRFEAQPTAGADLDKKPVYTYRVTADVIDISGETRSAETTVRVGAVALEVGTDLPQAMSADSLRSFSISTKNLNGETVERSGTLMIRELEPPKRVFKDRYWEAPDLYLLSQKAYKTHFPHLAYLDENEPRAWPAVRTVVEKDWTTGDFRLPKRLEPGTYLLTLTTTDRYGVEVSERQVIQLYDAAAEQLFAPQLAWSKLNDQTLEPGEELRLELATSTSALPALVEIARGDELLRSEWVTAEQWATFRHPVEEADRGGLTLYVSYAKLGRSFTTQQYVQVPWSNKQLNITYASFRDKLKPGAPERWTLKVTGPQQDAVAAEFLATLYDASLDAFAKNTFAADWWPTRGYSRRYVWQAPAYGAQRLGTQFRASLPYPEAQARRYAELLDDLLTMSSRYRYRDPSGGVMYSRMGAPEVQASAMADMPQRKVEAVAAMPAGVITEEVEAEAMLTDASAPSTDAAPDAAPPVRENLNETVFFFPQLRTDAEGNVLIDFTMNEALTEWKFLGLAHTKDLQVATTENTVVTQKELMVLPNAPRFLREGDEVVFSSKIVNVTDRPMNGNAVLQLVNPLNSTPVYKWADNPQFNRQFSVAPQSSTVVNWRFKVPSVTEAPLIEHTIIAEAGSYSDGERSLLPVLTNRMLVTETKPLPVSGESTTTFTFNSLLENDSKSLSHEGLTLELTSNPAWYAVQALPYLMEYPHECTEQIFSRYYANTLASSIANRHPRVKQIYQQWKQAGSDALVSNLAKNEELKTALLTETPWVMAAQSETEQKQRIGLLFDLNRMAQEQRTALTKIRKRQQAGGGWPWMPGEPDNWYISQYLVEGLAHLRELGATDAWTAGELDMLRKAVAYLDREAADAYKDLERRVAAKETTFEEDHLSPILLHYLYTRSYFLRPRTNQVSQNQQATDADRAYFKLDQQGRKVFDYYIGQAETYWNKRSLMQQALATLALHRVERNAEVQSLLKSFRERALHNEELGMYYRPESGYYWYQLPVRTHVKMIEVFDEVAGDAQAVNDLKVWLLKNKQTTHWKTTKATASAVYAFLSTGADWLAATQPVQVTWKDKQVQQQTATAQANAEAGTGYFKTRIDGAAVSDKLSTVTLTNPNPGPAWGALYWQYFEDIDKVESFEETPLTLQRKLFKVRTGPTGEVLEALDDGAKLQVGDKVRARVELRVDRAMEYVHLKDARAAGFEPVNVLSQYKYQDGLGYYESTTDAATNFFISYLRPGNYVFEYTLNATLAGDYSHGVTSIQCMYAPEYSSHSEGMRVVIE